MKNNTIPSHYNNPSQFRAYIALAWYAFRAQTRNPATFAFGFIFPLVFISIFGLIGNASPQLTVGIVPDIKSSLIVSALHTQPAIIFLLSDEATLNQKLQQGKIAGIIHSRTVGKKDQVTLFTSTANPQSAGALIAMVNSVAAKQNLILSGINQPPINVTVQEFSGRQTRYIDFALPGQIGFSLLSTAIFGTVFGLIYLKKAYVLKRMFATPTRAITILLAQGTSRLFIAMLQTILILIIGVLVFKFYLPHGIITFIELIVLSAFGLIAFLGFGYFFAGIANDENSAGPLVNLITLPQFLLSGTFFPTDSLPSWVQPIANNLPLSYFNLAVRKITTEGGSFPETFPYLLGLLLWGTVMYLLAAKTFRWE